LQFWKSDKRLEGKPRSTPDWQTVCLISQAAQSLVMKFAIFGFIFLVSITATCALYGWLESSVNMIEGLREFFRPGAGTIVFSPILLLFIGLGLGMFVGGSLLAVMAAATLGGVILRYRALTISQSFARFFVIVAIISQFVFILFAIEENAPFLVDRPRLHPNRYLAAFVAVANAALNLSAAAFIIRKQTGKLTPLPLP
jgi:hypothetical protein